MKILRTEVLTRVQAILINILHSLKSHIEFFDFAFRFQNSSETDLIYVFLLEEEIERKRKNIKCVKDSVHI